jgi:GNAT superfamily N-acetyltransferase
MPIDAETLHLVAANCAGAYRTWVWRLGKRTRLWDDLSCVDLELAVPLPPNGATLLRSPEPDEVDDLLRRIATFFAERRGGRYEIWSLWPIPNPFGCRDPRRADPLHDPRPGWPGSTATGRARDRGGGRRGDGPRCRGLIDGSFGARAAPGSLLTPACLDERLRVWVGYVEHRPVTTATAYVDERFVGVYAVATTPEARGHGYGEAITWAATLCRPDLPATLQASELGRPVYARMGYRSVAGFTVYERDRISG